MSDTRPTRLELAKIGSKFLKRVNCDARTGLRKDKVWRHDRRAKRKYLREACSKKPIIPPDGAKT
jgi:hypothetical protein